MAYEWISAAAAAAGQLGSSIAMSTKKRGSTRMMNVSKELARYNTQLSEEMYNKYQSPAAQMQQYKDAGLNPNLIYQNAGTGMPSAGQVSTNPEDYEDTRETGLSMALDGLVAGISKYQQVRSNQISNSNAELVGKLTGAQIQDVEERTRGIALDNFIKNATAGYQIEGVALDIADKTFRNAFKNIVDYQNALKDLDVKEANVRKSNASTKQIEEETENIRVQRDVLKGQIKINAQTLLDMEQAYKFNEKMNPLRIEGQIGSNRYQASATSLNGLRGQLYQKDIDTYDAKEEDRNAMTRATIRNLDARTDAIPSSEEVMVDGVLKRVVKPILRSGVKAVGRSITRGKGIR